MIQPKTLQSVRPGEKKTQMLSESMTGSVIWKERSRMGSPQYYDVYEDDKLLYSNKTSTEIGELVNIKPKYVTEYAGRCTAYHQRWRFVVHGNKLKEKNDFKHEDAIRWDEIRRAFFLLKHGFGEIVNKDGKKYTKKVR